MGQRHVGLRIAAPRESVFAIWVDPTRLREWQPDIQDVAAGPMDEVGARWKGRQGGPFAIRGMVTEVEQGRRHQQRFTELAGLVTCTVTASFEPEGADTRFDVDLDYIVAGGPIGRLLDGMVGSELVRRFGKDAERLKALAEQEREPTQVTRQP